MMASGSAFGVEATPPLSLPCVHVRDLRTLATFFFNVGAKADAPWQPKRATTDIFFHKFLGVVIKDILKFVHTATTPSYRGESTDKTGESQRISFEETAGSGSTREAEGESEERFTMPSASQENRPLTKNEKKRLKKKQEKVKVLLSAGGVRERVRPTHTKTRGGWGLPFVPRRQRRETRHHPPAAAAASRRHG